MAGPNFNRTPESPPLPQAGSGITLGLKPGGTTARTLALGSYRVLAEDRERLAPGPIRLQVWLVAIGRDSRVSWTGRPGGDAVIFPGEEPGEGTVTGYFTVSLGEVCGLPAKFVGVLDVFAVVGPWRSKPVELKLG